MKAIILLMVIISIIKARVATPGTRCKAIISDANYKATRVDCYAAYLPLCLSNYWRYDLTLSAG